MKTYVRPEICFVDLRVEERLAGSICQVSGSCTAEEIAQMQQAGIFGTNL